MILHDWNDEDAIRILQNAAATLPPSGGRVMIMETVLDEPGAGGAMGAFKSLMDMNMVRRACVCV